MPETVSTFRPGLALELLGDACLKPTIQFCHLVGALTQFAQQPRILHRNDRLRREVLQQRDLIVTERDGWR